MSDAPNHVSDFTFESILLESERLPAPIELKNITTDLEIFEHLNLPYLTALLSIVDSNNVYSDADLLGGETISVQIKSTRENAKAIRKKFYILEIINTQKVNDNNQVVSFQLIEDIGYISNLINLNKSYTGKSSLIIEKIAKNYLGKDLITSNNDSQSMKVIIPNLSPLEAMRWIKDDTTTTNGYPFYLFSTLAKNELMFFDLGTLLSEPIINDVPYRAWESASQSMDLTVSRRIIKNYEVNSFDNLYLLIKDGIIGAKYEFINTLKNERIRFDFDVAKDLLKPLLDKSVLKKPQTEPLFSPSYLHNEKSFNKYKSRTITNIGGSSPYKNTVNTFSAYSEGDNIADYKLGILSTAMNKLMKKNPMVITVSGLDFIDGDKHSTIGNNIRLVFQRAIPEDHSTEWFDPKLSGEYLIYAARHVFKKERYDITMTCIKLGNYKA